MKKLKITIFLLAALSCSSISYGRPSSRVIVYKGTIKASKSIFDVNDTNVLLTRSIKGYWAVEVVDTGNDEGQPLDSSAVVYDSASKYLKVMHGAISIDPCDPCGVVMFTFNPIDADGYVELHAVGKGKLTKFSNDAAVAKDYIPSSLKGAGLVCNFDFFDTDYVHTGPVTVKMTLDFARTRSANPYLKSPGDVISEVVLQLTAKGGWSEWPYVPAP